MKKKLLVLLAVIILSGTTWAVVYIDSLLPIITGYSAKYLCSAVFISHRDQKSVEELDLNFSFIQFAGNDVNHAEKSVTSHFLWGKSKAIYREGLGAVLVRDRDEATLRRQSLPTRNMAGYDQDTVPWPAGNRISAAETGIDRKTLERIAGKLFDSNGYGGTPFGFLVIHKGVSVAEKYRAGMNEKTRFLSWSVAKSFTNTLAGLMVGDGLLAINRKSLLKEWSADERSSITLENLLRMESGLEWNEDYGNRSDVTLMLYDQADFAGFALSKKLLHKPGTQWYYSSGTTNIVNLLMRRCFPTDSACYAYTRNRLFNKTGMPDAIFETDATGTPAGSSYVYATARDYGRFGLLYLNDGVFNGERILPEGWVKFTVTASAASRGTYGAFFWLNLGGMYPDAPGDMFSCNGHDGQQIFILPSKDLVIVVLGYSPGPDHKMDFNRLVKDIAASVPD